MDSKEARDCSSARKIIGTSSHTVNNVSYTFGPSHASSNGIANGIHSDEETTMSAAHSNHPTLRTALSCEDNDGVTSVDDGERNNMESGACPKYKSCRERLRGEPLDLELPSSSGANSVKVCEEALGVAEARRSRKRIAVCNAGKSNLEADCSSSDTSNDYSLGSEDGCIYTYRGGEHLADLPSSFFSLDMGLPADRVIWSPPPRPHEAPREEQRNSRASSPDMDYLEMDFDPGPSCEADSAETSPDEDLDASSSPEPPDRLVVVRGTTPDTSVMPHAPVAEVVPVVSSPDRSQARAMECQPSTSTGGITTLSSSMPGPSAVSCSPPVASCMQAGSLVAHVNARGEHVMVQRTCRRWPPRAPITHHTNSGDLVCERGGGEASNPCFADSSPAVDRVNLSSALYHCTMAKKLIVEKPNADFMEGADTSNVTEEEDADCDSGGDSAAHVCEVPRCMVWSEREACERQVTQIATSACGATAVVNAFLALGIPINTDNINRAVGTRQRANHAPVPRYLLSRSVAGCTAAGLVAGLHQASGGLLTARFFATHPERAVSLSHWLADWISLGAVPILTLNLQAGHEGDTEAPDAWHHQMVFGVSPRGVYLTNPVECVAESQLWPQLCSDSLLLVRSRDVLSRLTPATDLTPLMRVPDVRWATANVLGQVVNLMREARDSESGGGETRVRTRHVRVPCAYRAGVTVAALTGSEAHRRLTRAQQLPLYAPRA